MKLIIIIILLIILIVVSVQIYFFLKENRQLKIKLDNLNTKISALTKENVEIQSEIEYFSFPENLEKELRQKFNYKKPGEKMVIIVP